jgi:hypothetical protein
MTMTEIPRKTRAALREAKQEGRSGGPRTPEGKTISSLNSLKHGLLAQGAVLPGEDVQERVRRIEDTIVALGATNEPLARLAAGIEEDLGKIERIDRIERGLILGRIEELLAQTGTGERAKKTAKGLQAVGTACQHFTRAPFPAQRGPEIDLRIHVMQTALFAVSDLVESPPMDLVADCHRHLTAIADKTAHPAIPAASVNALVDAAQKLLDALFERATRDEAVQTELRAAIAMIALPAEAELKKLARYAKLVEESLTRRLAALEQLRNATENVTPATEEQAREFRLRLRVVK